jgi:hypothetical protein
MTLYIATEKGNIPMRPEEEAKVLAEWAANEAKPVAEKPKSLEERVAAIEKVLGLA